MNLEKKREIANKAIRDSAVRKSVDDLFLIVAKLEKKKRYFLNRKFQAEAAAEKQLQKLKSICTHPVTKIVSQDYFEQGRMSSPVSWKEEQCVICETVVARSTNETKEVWHKTK